MYAGTNFYFCYFQQSVYESGSYTRFVFKTLLTSLVFLVVHDIPAILSAKIYNAP